MGLWGIKLRGVDWQALNVMQRFSRAKEALEAAQSRLSSAQSEVIEAERLYQETSREFMVSFFGDSEIEARRARHPFGEKT